MGGSVKLLKDNAEIRTNLLSNKAVRDGKY